ncbi:MAG: DUF1838 family protein [Rhodospirillaceae bacterium]
MTDQYPTNTSMEIRTGLVVEDYDSLGGPETSLTRRQTLGVGAGIAASAGTAAGTMAMAFNASAATPDINRRIQGASLTGPYVDLTTADGNMLAIARIESDIDMRTTTYGWYDGLVMGVSPGGPVKNICGFKGMSCKRLIPYKEGVGYRKLLREVGFYYDLITGEIMEEMVNPYTDEKVRVVHIANDPFNGIIRNIISPGPAYGGLNATKREPKPFILDWMIKDEWLLYQRHIHLYYKNALDPREWVRESAGPMNRVSELFFNVHSLHQVQNEELTHVYGTGTWARITPWLPWMLMGQAPGHVVYQTFMGSRHSLDDIPHDIVEYTAKKYPRFLEAPEVWEEPSLSSIERYSREQEPALPSGV